MRISWFLLLFVNQCVGFSQEIYDDFLLYGKFIKLSSCITKERLFEKRLNEGGCDLKLCKSPKMANVEVVKIRKAPMDENGTGFVALNHDEKKVIVSFRSSTTYSDWMSDFEIVYEDYVPMFEYNGIPECEGCQVHRGFYKHLSSITDEIIKPIEQIYQDPRYEDYQLVFTGHSLGGALATLVGIEFRIKGFKPLVISYGSPRIFNEAMMNWVNEVFESEKLTNKINKDDKKNPVVWGILRLTHEGDYVPGLPPGFRQAGVEFHIAKRDLPHAKDDVVFAGTSYVDMKENLSGRKDRFPWRIILDHLHATEHRTYFMAINSCSDPDFI